MVKRLQPIQMFGLRKTEQDPDAKKDLRVVPDAESKEKDSDDKANTAEENPPVPSD